MGRPPYKDNDWVLGGPTLSATPGAILKVSTVDCGDSEQNNSLSWLEKCSVRSGGLGALTLVLVPEMRARAQWPKFLRLQILILRLPHFESRLRRSNRASYGPARCCPRAYR
jgi:hypothetical protein